MITEFVAGVVLGCLVYAPNLCLKDGVRITGEHFYPEMVRILDVARETAPMLERGTVWITSANDSRHMNKSLHYKNRAFDIRVMNIIGDVKREAKLWAERMQLALGDNYVVLFEVDHIHVEFDPFVEPEEEPESDVRVDYGTG